MREVCGDEKALTYSIPVYAGYEFWLGRFRAFKTTEFLLCVLDTAGHDPGDEDRYGGLGMVI